MFLDVLGGCVAFLAVAQVQTLCTLLARRSKSVSAVMNALERRSDTAYPECDVCQSINLLRHHYQYLEVLFQRVLGDLSAWKSALGPLRGLANQVEHILEEFDGPLHATVHPHLVEYIRTGDELPSLKWGTSIAYAASVAVPLIGGAGVACYVVGGLCFVQDKQPVGVWVASFGVVFGTLLLFGTMVKSVSTARKIMHTSPDRLPK